MSSKNIPTAKTFCDAFLSSYCQARACFTDARWASFNREPTGSRNFSRLMKTRPGDVRNLPPETTKLGISVLADVAARLGLCWVKGEPMTLDIALVEHSATERWYPIVVAIEHENRRYTFEHSEIPKLFSVRCPLKVCITYVESADPRRGLEEIRQHLKNRFDLISQIVGEDTRTEYLFLVGAPLVLSDWYVISFLASEGPGNKSFCRASSTVGCPFSRLIVTTDSGINVIPPTLILPSVKLPLVPIFTRQPPRLHERLRTSLSH